MPHPSLQLTFDAGDPDALSRFWAETLGYKLQDPPEGFPTWDAFLEANNLMHLQGRASAIVDPEGKRPRIYFQKVPEGKTAKNRLHIDVNVVGRQEVSDEERRSLLEAEAERLAGFGASRTSVYDENGELWVVMADPEGNEFCLQ